ncbi:MAG: PspC domain-containing protein [Pseudomonadota bacterium]
MRNHHYEDRHRAGPGGREGSRNWGEHGGYSRRAGQPGPGPNPHRLRRNMHDAKIAGVCAGVADYFGWNTTILRIGAFIGAFVFFPWTVIAYFAAAMVIERDDQNPQPVTDIDEEEQRFWRTFATRPRMAFSALKHRFRALEARVADIERTVTSDEYGLKRAFRDLEQGR